MIDDVLVDHLHAVLARVGIEHLDRPSHLEMEIRREAGGEPSTTHGHQIRLLVAALDENLPRLMLGAAPLSGDDVARMATFLARTRGWNAGTAAGVVGAWRSALEVDIDTGAGHTG